MPNSNVDISDKIAGLADSVQSLEAFARGAEPAIASEIAIALCHIQLGMDLLSFVDSDRVTDLSHTA